MSAGEAVASAPGVMEALKTQTTEQHQAAERHAFQKLMMSGRLSRAAYAENIAQLMFVHRELEDQLRRLRGLDPRVNAIVPDRHFHAAEFAADVAFMGGDASRARPLAGTSDVVAELRSQAQGFPLRALGMHYVLEGSTNGGFFIAKAVTRAYGFTGAEGTRWLNPYGDGQRGLWQGFKDAMNNAGFTPVEIEEMVSAAKWMFDGVSRVGTAVLEAHPQQTS